MNTDLRMQAYYNVAYKRGAASMRDAELLDAVNREEARLMMLPSARHAAVDRLARRVRRKVRILRLAQQAARAAVMIYVVGVVVVAVCVSIVLLCKF
jgi:hypothetical protein